MKTLKNERSYALEIAATAQVVEPGETADVVDDDLAKALLEQPDNWSDATPAKAKSTKSEEG